jgi:putative redox protein
VKARIKLVDGMTFLAESETGHGIVIDAAPDIGGRNLGARPMELVLIGTGACTAIDVVHILRKARQPITDCEVEVSAERASEDPKVFTKIHLHYIVTGKGLSQPQVERAVKLSKEKYCSATKMLEATVAISFDHEVREA